MGDARKSACLARNLSASKNLTYRKRTPNRSTIEGFSMAKHSTIQAERREDARRKLIGYRASCQIYHQLLKIVGDAEDRLTTTCAQYEETITSKTAKDSLGDQIVMLDDQVTRLSGICATQARTLDEILELINGVVPIDATSAQILSKRYLEPIMEPTFAEIAADLGYSEDYVKHKHLEGLDLIAEKISE